MPLGVNRFGSLCETARTTNGTAAVAAVAAAAVAVVVVVVVVVVVEFEKPLPVSKLVTLLSLYCALFFLY